MSEPKTEQFEALKRRAEELFPCMSAAAHSRWVVARLRCVDPPRIVIGIDAPLCLQFTPRTRPKDWR